MRSARAASAVTSPPHTAAQHVFPNWQSALAEPTNSGQRYGVCASPADTPVHACRPLRRRSFAPWRVDRCGLSHSAANPCEFQVPVPRTIRHRRDGQKERRYNGLPQCRVTAGESFPAHQVSRVRQTSGIFDDRAACVQYWDQSLRAEFRAGAAHARYRAGSTGARGDGVGGERISARDGV